MSIRDKIKEINARVQSYAGRLPPGLRLVLGILLISGGILGFLPILGFWMIPVGISVAALDAVPLYRIVRYGRAEARKIRMREQRAEVTARAGRKRDRNG